MSRVEDLHWEVSIRYTALGILQLPLRSLAVLHRWLEGKKARKMWGKGI